MGCRVVSGSGAWAHGDSAIGGGAAGGGWIRPGARGIIDHRSSIIELPVGCQNAVRGVGAQGLEHRTGAGAPYRTPALRAAIERVGLAASLSTGGGQVLPQIGEHVVGRYARATIQFTQTNPDRISQPLDPRLSLVVLRPVHAAQDSSSAGEQRTTVMDDYQ